MKILRQSSCANGDNDAQFCRLLIGNDNAPVPLRYLERLAHRHTPHTSGFAHRGRDDGIDRHHEQQDITWRQKTTTTNAVPPRQSPSSMASARRAVALRPQRSRPQFGVSGQWSEFTDAESGTRKLETEVKSQCRQRWTGTLQIITWNCSASYATGTKKIRKRVEPLRLLHLTT